MAHAAAESGAAAVVAAPPYYFPAAPEQLASWAGDRDRVAAVLAQARLLAQLYEVGRMPGRIVVGIKAALAARGICGPAVASSFEQFDDGQHRRVHDILAVLPAARAAPIGKDLRAS